MIKARVIAQTVYELVANDGREPELVVDRLVRFVERNNLTQQLPSIFAYLEQVAGRTSADEAVVVHTATPMPPETMHAITRYINAPPDATVTEHIDPTLIGGFIARYRGIVHDASIATQLRRLREELRSVYV